jgi:hypothetical protein
MNKTLLGILDSSSDNRKSKMAGAFSNCGGWGCGSGAAAEEGPSDRVSIVARPSS